MTIQRLGKYELLESLGTGATSEVYRARDAVLGREVALKVLKPSLVADPSAYERFVKEAQAAAGLFHPNIATVLDMGEADGRYFIAMRLIPGKSLDRILKESGPLPWEEVLRLVRQVGGALDFAHKQGFLHRDVKPSNIICTPEGEFVLTDFGLQRAMLSTGLTSHTGVILGTPAYIAPEVWEGKPAVPATDQYALACVIYEALTGEVLFSGDTPMAVMRRHSDGWRQPAHWPDKVPASIEAVLQKALAPLPHERYPDMAAFSAALEGLKTGHPAVVGKEQDGCQKDERQKDERQELPASPAPGRPQPVRLKVWAVVAGLIVLIGIGAAIGSGLLKMGQKGLGPLAGLATKTTTPTLTATITPTPTSTPLPTATLTPTPDTRPTWLRPADGMVMVYVPEGEFKMGMDAEDGYAICQQYRSDCERNWFINEEPVHTVTLDAFWIDKTEVTNSMYALCVRTGFCVVSNETSTFTRFDYYNDSQYADYPMINVTWYSARDYCAWADARLPTEAEWEKAARGTDGLVYPWGNSSPDCSLANYGVCTGDTNAVGSFLSGVSPYGALDMSGNVAEWVNDWYGETYYSQSPSSNPQGPSTGAGRGIRGGANTMSEFVIRSAGRAAWGPEFSNAALGFRCALSASP